MVGRRDLLKRVGAAGAVVVGGGAATTLGEGAMMGGASMDVPPPKAYALLVVDRSGSMSSVRQATIEGLNTWLAEQRDKADLLISLIQFDTSGIGPPLNVTETFDFVSAPKTRDLVEGDYVPRGSTPLRAAFVDGIARLEKLVRPQDRALLVVQTDGADNTSPLEITTEVVRNLVQAKEAEGNWTFVFMGADIDAWGEGGAIGVAAGNTQQYANTNQGTTVAYAAASLGTTSWYLSDTTTTQDFYNTPVTTVADISVRITPTPEETDDE